ncbi:MAG: hypothetical protein ACYC6Y_25665 [Thermoguttaceae bacterium]
MNGRFPLFWLLSAVVLVPLVAVIVAVFASPTWREHRRKCELIRQIHDRSGLVRVERSGPDWMRPLGAYYRNGDANFAPIGVYDRVVEVRLIDARLTDDFLARLGECRSLRVLNLSRSDVTGEGLKHLVRLGSLEDLDLSYTKVGDDDMATVGQMGSLRRLDLSRDRLSGRGLHRLGPLENLQTVCLVATPLRDGALKSLASLRSLSTCNIFGCVHLSRESVEAFRKARPDCRLFGVHSIEPSWKTGAETGKP